MMETDGRFAVIVDHYQHPRNYGALTAPDFACEDENPGCGDRIRIHANVSGQGHLDDIRFGGDGCVISIAASSVLTTLVQGLTIEQALNMPEITLLDALAAQISPRRHACALLGYRVLRSGLVQYVHEQRVGRKQICSIVLAAGHSKRMGNVNKLLLRIEDAAIVERTVSTIIDAGLGDVIVVTGADAEKVTEVLRSYPVQLVENPEHGEGMAASIRAGVRAASPDVVGFALFLADMPFIRSETVASLGAVLRSHPGSVVVPQCDGRLGHPVLFDSRFRHDLLRLQGDTGARSVLEAHPDAIVRLNVEDPGISQDIDTREDLLRLRPA